MATPPRCGFIQDYAVAPVAAGPFAPIFKADAITLSVSREKDGKLEMVYGRLPTGHPESQVNAGSVHGPRDAFIHEGKRVPPLHVSGV